MSRVLALKKDGRTSEWTAEYASLTHRGIYLACLEATENAAISAVAEAFENIEKVTTVDELAARTSICTGELYHVSRGDDGKITVQLNRCEVIT